MNRLFRLILRIILLLLIPLRVIGRLLVTALDPALNRIDGSHALSNIINSLSSSMASQRGLLLIIGTALLVVSLFAHLIVIVGLVSLDAYDRNLYWLCIPFGIFHIGVLAGFTGAMLASPLGQSYRDN